MLKNLIFMACTSAVVVSCNKKEETTQTSTVSSDELFSLAETNDVDALAKFIKQGADLKQKGEGGNTLLHLAALHGSNEVVEKLLLSGVDIDAINEKEETPLIVATRAGHTNVVKTLLRRNASPDLKDSEGFLPLSIAALDGNEAMVEALALYSRQHLDQALFMVAHGGHSAMVNPLTNYGASVYSRLDIDGSTPLMMAAEKGHLETVRVLLENGANRYSTNNEGKTASELAILAGQDTVANFLGEIPDQDDFSIVEVDETTLSQAVGQAAQAEFVYTSAKAVASGSSAPKPKKLKAKYIPLNGGTLKSSPKKLSESLQIRTYREESLPVKVSGVDSKKVTVKYLFGDHRTVEVKTGETIPDTNLKVVSAVVKRDASKMSAGLPADISQVKVEDQTTGKVTQMTTGVNVGRTEPFAVIKEKGSDFFLVAKRGDLFKGENGTQYEVLEVRPTQLVVMNTATGNTETIHK